MVLDKKRKNVDPLLTKFAKVFSSVNPNTLSFLSLIFAFLAGLFFFYSNPEEELENFILYFAALFVFLNGFFDAIDGKVAKLTNKASKQGDFIDHVIDRYADIFIVGGIAFSSWCDIRIGFLAIIGMLLTSYMGTQSQAVGIKRNYSGLLGRADRLALLMIIPILQHLVLEFEYELPYNLTLLEIMLIYFAVVGNITALQRLIGTLLWFRKNPDKK